MQGVNATHGRVLERTSASRFRTNFKVERAKSCHAEKSPGRPGPPSPQKNLLNSWNALLLRLLGRLPGNQPHCHSRVQNSRSFQALGDWQLAPHAAQRVGVVLVRRAQIKKTRKCSLSFARAAGSIICAPIAKPTACAKDAKVRGGGRRRAGDQSQRPVSLSCVQPRGPG